MEVKYPVGTTVYFMWDFPEKKVGRKQASEVVERVRIVTEITAKGTITETTYKLTNLPHIMREESISDNPAFAG